MLPTTVSVAPREGGTNGNSSTCVGKKFRRPERLGDMLSDVRDFQGNMKTVAGGTEGKKEGPVSKQEHLRGKFYKLYQKEAEEYDKEFMKKYDEDLNTTLIFAGLFSAVASAFIILVHSEFQPDPNEETNALLRVIIHQIDNTTFGGQVPIIPQWAGPSQLAVQVQAILVASLSVSLLSAFLAMLGKQWLNRCIPVDMQGTIIERGQYRQRKIDGIVNWYFDHVITSLPLMLQAALLLLGCALSRFLWDFNTTVASVVIAITASGLLFYLFILIAGAASVNCPYQTPGATFIRYIPYMLLQVQDILGRAVRISVRIEDLLHRIPDIFRRVSNILQHPLHIFHTLHAGFSTAINESHLRRVLVFTGRIVRHWQSSDGFLSLFFINILLLPIWLIVDACRTVIWLLAAAVYLLQQARSEPERQAVVGPLDLRCILWVCRTSVEEHVRLSALEYLRTMVPHNSDAIQTVADWFDILTSCVQVKNRNVMVVQGLEQLAASSSVFCLHMLSHLAAMDPMPKILQDVRQQYIRTFPFRTKFDGLPFSHTFGIIHNVFHSISPGGLGSSFRTNTPTHPGSQQFLWRHARRRVQWGDFEPPSDVHITVARALTKLAWFDYQRSERVKVPRLFLRFALHSLSQDPPLPPSAIADSLTIIAIDLECDTSNFVAVEPSDQSAQVGQVLGLITEKLASLADGDGRNILSRKCKAITALLPYATLQGRDTQHPILDVLLRAVKASRSSSFSWHHIRPFLERQLNGAGDVSLKRVIMVASPYIPWGRRPFDGDLVKAWAAAASAIPKEEGVAPSIVDTLLQIAHQELLQPHHHSDVWSWLTLRPSLPPTCKGREGGSHPDVVRMFRDLKDIEILKSYLLLVWSEWDFLYDAGFRDMCNLIRKDFSGIEMHSHRADLVERLDHVLEQLDRGLEHLRQDKPKLSKDDLQEGKDQYGKLREILLEEDRKR